MLATTLTTILRRQGAVEAPYVFSPSELFASGEEGVWYDPSDFTTLYTDTAGTTAITAVEQPVGYMADKSGNGNHAVAANGSTARPVLRNRYNLLTYSEQFDNAAWPKTSVSVTANAAVAPDGATTADLMYPSSTGSLRRILRTVTGLVDGAEYTAIYYIKPTSGFSSKHVQLYCARATMYVDLSNGSIGTTTGSPTESSVEVVEGGYYKIKLSAVVNLAAGSQYVQILLSDADNSTVITADGSEGIYIWGAQLTTAADHDAINGEYQRIAAAPTVGAAPTYDDDVTKFPPYLYATTDDAMSTASIDFSGGDEMSVFAGVTKESDAAAGNLIELAALAGSNGKFTLFAPGSAGANYFWRSRGTLDASSLTAGSYPAPITSVLTGIGDIGDDICKLRYNATEILNLTTDQGTGNYGNYPLYLFARNNASNFFNGRLYSLIVRNALTSGDELDNVEAYVAQKTGVTL